MMFKVSRWSTCLNDLTKPPCKTKTTPRHFFLKENGLIAKRVEVPFKGMQLLTRGEVDVTFLATPMPSSE